MMMINPCTSKENYDLCRMVSITDTGIRLISATGRPHLKHWADKQQPTIDPKARCELYTDISQKKAHLAAIWCGYYAHER